MRLGIDASNLRTGGGVTHIVELLEAARPQELGITKVVLWAGQQTLRQLPERMDKPWLEYVHEPLLDRSLPARLYWQRVKLPRLARQHCDCLFVPGGSFSGAFRPFVTMSRNMLPFESREWSRYGFSWMAAKMFLLRFSQSRSLRNADGVIFLTEYARSVVTPMAGLPTAERNAAGRNNAQLVIPHGVHPRFFREPREQRLIAQFSPDRPFNLLYVSKVEPYKHQWRVVEAMGMLRQRKLPVTLSLVGEAACSASARRLKETIRKVDPHGEFIHQLGNVPHAKLPDFYHNADGFVFASSCENLPNILLEAMASGLPIACSDHGPMPEVLGPAGVYFNPECTAELAAAMQLLVEDRALRQYFAETAYERAQRYSWERCASETFSYLALTASAWPRHYGEALEPVRLH